MNRNSGKKKEKEKKHNWENNKRRDEKEEASWSNNDELMSVIVSPKKNKKKQNKKMKKKKKEKQGSTENRGQKPTRSFSLHRYHKRKIGDRKIDETRWAERSKITNGKSSFGSKKDEWEKWKKNREATHNFNWPQKESHCKGNNDARNWHDWHMEERFIEHKSWKEVNRKGCNVLQTEIDRDNRKRERLNGEVVVKMSQVEKERKKHRKQTQLKWQHSKG